MDPNIKLKAIGLCFLFMPTLGFSINLVDSYSLAHEHDPEFLAAKYSHLAIQQSIPEARALFLPVVNMDLNSSGVKSKDPEYGIYNAHSYKISLTQPFFIYQNWIQYAQAKDQVQQSNANLGVAEQNLILTVANNYISTLKATAAAESADNLTAVLNVHLFHIKKRHSKGAVGNIELYEAQNRYNDALASAIDSKIALLTETKKLENNIGQPVDQVLPLKDDIVLNMPEPNEIEPWLEMARQANLKIMSARFATKVAHGDVKIKTGEYLPNISLNAQVQRATREPNGDVYFSKRAGIQVNVPIFAGGSTFYKTKKSQMGYKKELSGLDKAIFDTEENIKSTFGKIKSLMEKAKILEENIKIGKQVINYTITGFDFGNRTLLDLLNAEREFQNIKSEYQNTRYNYLIETLKLKQLAGILTFTDLKLINDWLITENETIK